MAKRPVHLLGIEAAHRLGDHGSKPAKEHKYNNAYAGEQDYSATAAVRFELLYIISGTKCDEE
ncbi:protein of unknown function [Shewanella benthica]|uniref:Uncharacterized protein n=1 Tax=Shewanella benthica TaxID=43661 RepID=A0A330M062_9GAMM|nr:protein of unknown function [Shewanella benthica]